MTARCLHSCFVAPWQYKATFAKLSTMYSNRAVCMCYEVPILVCSCFFILQVLPIVTMTTWPLVALSAHSESMEVYIYMQQRTAIQLDSTVTARKLEDSHPNLPHPQPRGPTIFQLCKSSNFGFFQVCNLPTFALQKPTPPKKGHIQDHARNDLPKVLAIQNSGKGRAEWLSPKYWHLKHPP